MRWLDISRLAVNGLARRPARTSLTVLGVSLGTDVPVSVLAGRLPKPGSLTEAVVTQGYLDKTGATPQDSVGKELQLAEPRAERGSALPFRPRWVRTLIVGVVSQDIPSADLLVPLEQTRAARAWERSGGAQAIFATQLGVTASPYTGLIVVATSVDTMHGVREGIDALGYATSAPEKILGAILRYLHVVDIVLAGIGSIALFVAGLNIANALLAAVRERRREIGVLKAIGARDSDVLRWFLVEAALTGLAGGIGGTLIGALRAQGR